MKQGGGWPPVDVATVFRIIKKNNHVLKLLPDFFYSKSKNFIITVYMQNVFPSTRSNRQCSASSRKPLRCACHFDAATFSTNDRNSVTEAIMVMSSLTSSDLSRFLS